MRKHLVFIVNPHSGNERKKNLLPYIHQYLDASKFTYEIQETEYAGHGTVLAQEAVAKEVYAVIAVGGDGSVNDVAQALLNKPVAMGIIPKGSGNGLARALRLPRKYAEAIKNLNYAKPKSIDAGRANERLFLSNSGVGFDAFVMEGFQKLNKRGLQAYSKRIINALFSYQDLPIRLQIGSEDWTEKIFIISVANGSQFGYDFKITKRAKLDDGLLDVLVIKKVPFWYYPVLAFHSLNGTLASSKFAIYRQVTHLQLSSPQLNQFQIDGEHHGCGGNLKIEILPACLSVLQ